MGEVRWMDEELPLAEDGPRIRRAERWLAVLPLAVMTWTIYDVATHEFNKWTMLRTVLLVVFSVPAFVGAVLGGAIGLKVGSTVGLGLALFGLMIGMIAVRVFFL